MRSRMGAGSFARMRETAPIALLVALALCRTAHAADPGDDPCARAKAQLGSSVIERGMSAEQCQVALDSAEEERWQLWLDIAAAHELGGDVERSALSLNKFLAAADRRPRPLSAQWVVMRDEARLKIARADTEVLKTKGRVTIISTPEGAEATIIGGGATLADKSPKAPLTAYFEPGSHSVRLRIPATEATREVSFTVVAGSVIELRVDLRPGAKPDTSVSENPGPPVLGQRDPTDLGASPQEVAHEPVSVLEEPIDNDPEGPPVRDSSASIMGSLGTVSIAAGGAALAMGITFALVASGLDDEARCSGAACDVDTGLRDHVRRDADVAWDRATGTLIVGSLLVAGGIVAIIFDDGDDGAPTTSVTPWIGPNGGGLSGQMRF